MRLGSACTSLCLTLTLSTSVLLLQAQEEQPRGRKYNPPPPVAHIAVTVNKASNGKAVEGAAVIFHTVHNGKDQGNLEVKTNEEGRAVIDVIPIGDTIRMQVIKSGYQTFGEDYTVSEAAKEIVVKMRPPARQYSIYEKHPEGGQESGAGASPTPSPSQSAAQPHS